MGKSKKVLYHKVDLFLIHSWQPSLPHCLRPSDPPWYQTQPQLLPKRWTSWTCMDHIGYWYWCIEYAYPVHFFGKKRFALLVAAYYRWVEYIWQDVSNIYLASQDELDCWLWDLLCSRRKHIAVCPLLKGKEEHKLGLFSCLHVCHAPGWQY